MEEEEEQPLLFAGAINNCETNRNAGRMLNKKKTGALNVIRARIKRSRRPGPRRRGCAAAAGGNGGRKRSKSRRGQRRPTCLRPCTSAFLSYKHYSIHLFFAENGERKNKQDDQSLNDSVKFLDHCSPRFLQSRDSFAAQGTRMAMG
jgi:hypothetical protein